MKFKFLLISATTVAIFLSVSALNASAAINYGTSTYESSFAATSTQKVGEAIDQVVKGDLGATSTSDVGGMVTGAGNIFVRINDWLREKAGIDFFGILKAIGHLFLSTVGFFFDLIKRAL